MITVKTIEEAAFQAIRNGSTNISPDVRDAFEKAILNESNDGARNGLEKTLESIKLAEILCEGGAADE